MRVGAAEEQREEEEGEGDGEKREWQEGESAVWEHSDKARGHAHRRRTMERVVRFRRREEKKRGKREKERPRKTL